MSKEIHEAIKFAVNKTLEEIGLEEFKKTSLFLSNQKKLEGNMYVWPE